MIMIPVTKWKASSELHELASYWPQIFRHSLRSIHPFGGALLSSSSAPPVPLPFSFLRSWTSQLYTRAVATSIVCALVSRIHLRDNDERRLAYRDLLPQEIEILLTIQPTLLRRAQFLLEEIFGFCERV